MAADVHGRGDALDAIEGAVDGLDVQLQLAVKVVDPLVEAVVRVGEVAEPGLVELDHVNADGGEALHLGVDDAGADAHGLLGGSVGGRTTSPPSTW